MSKANTLFIKQNGDTHNFYCQNGDTHNFWQIVGSLSRLEWSL